MLKDSYSSIDRSVSVFNSDVLIAITNFTGEIRSSVVVLLLDSDEPHDNDSSSSSGSAILLFFFLSFSLFFGGNLLRTLVSA